MEGDRRDNVENGNGFGEFLRSFLGFWNGDLLRIVVGFKSLELVATEFALCGNCVVIKYIICYFTNENKV